MKSKIATIVLISLLIYTTQSRAVGCLAQVSVGVVSFDSLAVDSLGQMVVQSQKDDETVSKMILFDGTIMYNN